MSYFKNFGKLVYDFTIKSDKTVIKETVVDLSTRIELKIKDSTVNAMCDSYIVQDGETPEMISNKLYKNPFYHWTILYINKIGSFFAEWPLTELALHAFIAKKYGVDNVNATHHYECEGLNVEMDFDFIVAEYGEVAAIQVTNYEYESRLNEAKRLIKVIKPNRLSWFVDIYNKEAAK